MSDENPTPQPDQQPTQAAPVETPEKEVTLDDVYRDAGLDKPTVQPSQTVETPAPRTEPSSFPTPTSVPDPYDTENFKAFIARQAAGTSALESAVKQLVGYVSEQSRQQAVAATRADIDKAVNAIEEVVQIGKPKVVEAYLDGMVREDARMKAIWENRGKNPTAWTNAVKIAAKKMSEDFSLKTDPNLVASQRARKEAQRQMATTAQEGPDQSWDGLSQEDFGRKWEQMLNGGSQ